MILSSITEVADLVVTVMVAPLKDEMGSSLRSMTLPTGPVALMEMSGRIE